MDSAKAKADYAAFEERVRRTVYIDNLSPQVNESILKSAFNQFGNVQKVEFIPNYAEESNLPCSALVEMDSPELAKKLVQAMSNQPFMVFGMPRPVRVCAAGMEMFEYRPQKPGVKITCQWLEPQNPDFTIAEKLKELTRRHAAEASFLLQYQLKEEEKLAKQQAETLEANYKKYELIEKVLKDGTAKRCYLQKRVLNLSKGPAVRALRAQTDKREYAMHMRGTVESTPNLCIREAMVTDILLGKNDNVEGVRTFFGMNFYASSVILTTGTFMSGKIWVGGTSMPAGRAGESASLGLTENLQRLGFETDRLKTGTPARVDSRTVDFSGLEPQGNDLLLDPIKSCFEMLAHILTINQFSGYIGLVQRCGY